VKLLIDECVDCRPARHLTGHDVKTVAQMGWAGAKNGALLRLAEAEFEVLVTVDRNLSFQQNLTNLKLAVLVLHARTNSLDDLKSLVPRVLEILPALTDGRVEHVGD
jgi:hypothetical protein